MSCATPPVCPPDLAPRRRAARPLAVLALVALCASTAAAAEPTGFGKAKFGATSAAVKKLYPAARPAGEQERLQAPYISGPEITRLVLDAQTVAGLPKPVLVELRFWKDKLWTVVVYFGENGNDEVIAQLTKQLGAPQSTDPTQPIWMGEKTQTIATTKQRWYSSNDLKLSLEAQSWLAEKLRHKGHDH